MPNAVKITKFTHSCVLVESSEGVVLFDPGIFSWESGLVNLETFPRIDRVVVSHQHSDHCAEPFVRALVDKFPDLSWYAPRDSFEVLRSWGVNKVSNESTAKLVISEQNHALVEPFGVQVNNLVSHWSGVVTHPGDTHDFTETKDILLLPIQAPWGTTIRAIELVYELKPKYVLPIHDWMWNEKWRESVYTRLDNLLIDSSTKFIRPEGGKSIEVIV